MCPQLAASRTPGRASSALTRFIVNEFADCRLIIVSQQVPLDDQEPAALCGGIPPDPWLGRRCDQKRLLRPRLRRPLAPDPVTCRRMRLDCHPKPKLGSDTALPRRSWKPYRLNIPS